MIQLVPRSEHSPSRLQKPIKYTQETNRCLFSAPYQHMNAPISRRETCLLLKTTGTYSNQWTLKGKNTVVTVRTTSLTLKKNCPHRVVTCPVRSSQPTELTSCIQDVVFSMTYEMNITQNFERLKFVVGCVSSRTASLAQLRYHKTNGNVTCFIW